MRKSIFLAAMAASAVALASCTKSEVTSVAQEAISFKSYTNDVTKAASVTADNVYAETFHVDSYKTDGMFSNVAPTPNISNETLRYNANQNWVVGNIYFWPVQPDKNMPTIFESFFAVNGGCEIKSISAANEYPTFDYTVASTEADMKDILVANYMNKTEGAVKFNFYHALAKLNFSIMGADDGGGSEATNDLVNYTYNLKTLTITDLLDKATFTYNDAEGAVPGLWSDAVYANTTTSYTYTLPEYSSVLNTGYLSLSLPVDDTDTTPNNSLLIMPQANTEFTVTITYTIDVDGDQIYPTDGTSIATAAVTIDDLTFAPNSSTKIKLVIPTPGDYMKFEVNTQDWDTEQEVSADGYKPQVPDPTPAPAV